MNYDLSVGRVKVRNASRTGVVSLALTLIAEGAQ